VHLEEEDRGSLVLLTGQQFQVHQEEEDGGILVFLTGQDEIELVKQTLLEAASHMSHPRNLQLLPVPVYAALPAEEQAAAFARLPQGTRKVVLATNIAETSVTVPGVRFVIDSGMVKARAFSAARGMESLQVRLCHACTRAHKRGALLTCSSSLAHGRGRGSGRSWLQLRPELRAAWREAPVCTFVGHL
jgi:HrpA-like RNA helicase